MVTQGVDTHGVELPVSPGALLARCRAEPFLFALDGGDQQSWGSGRALLGSHPRATLRVAATGAAVMCDGRAHPWSGDPFDLLDRFCTQWLGTYPPTHLQTQPCGGGVLAALSYDLRHWVERLPARARDDLALPVLHAAFYDWVLSYSYTSRRYQLASASRSPEDLGRIAARLRRLASAPGEGRATRRPCVVAEWSKEQYLAAARAVLEHITAGDAYQVNLAQRFVVRDAPHPAVLFAVLQRQHPVPFGAYVDTGDFVLVSNSPECFLTLHGDAVTTFPIKGTRPRAADDGSDQVLTTELQTDAKERAEHIMIVDLERNDLGKICQTGSVRVADFARVRTFRSLHHLVSAVSGKLRPGISLAEVLRATFPGGSVTGAPKIRAMEIIDEIEPVSRGLYTGAIGFVGAGGDAVFNLAIRTGVATPRKFTYHAGGGIVADSVPTREYDETLLKARAFFAALAATA